MLSEVRQGIKIDVDDTELDTSANSHKRYTSQTVKSVAGISSNGAVLRSQRKLELSPRKDLVVNRLPKVRLRVPLD